MHWAEESGDAIDPDIMKIYYQRHKRYPPEYYRQPLLTYEEKSIRDIFNELCTEKQTDYGRIPHSKIKSFCDYYKMDFDYILYIIRRLEDEVFKILKKREEKENKKIKK